MNESDADELRRLRHEIEVLRKRKGILDAGAITYQNAQTDKCNAETAKIKRETWLYPYVVIGGLIAAMVTAAKLIWGS